jgi:hypothetical protein
MDSHLFGEPKTVLNSSTGASSWWQNMPGRRLHFCHGEPLLNRPSDICRRRVLHQLSQHFQDFSKQPNAGISDIGNYTQERKQMIGPIMSRRSFLPVTGKKPAEWLRLIPKNRKRI